MQEKIINPPQSTDYSGEFPEEGAGLKDRLYPAPNGQLQE